MVVFGVLRLLALEGMGLDLDDLDSAFMVAFRRAKRVAFKPLVSRPLDCSSAFRSETFMSEKSFIPASIFLLLLYQSLVSARLCINVRECIVMYSDVL